MSASAIFMNDVAAHLENFARSKGVKPEEIHVRFTFADGSVFLVQGLKLSASTAVQGWGMIEGAVAIQRNRPDIG